MPKANNNLLVTVIPKLRWEPFCANAYDLRSSTAVIRYHYATVGFPVKETWCKAIENGNYNTWLGLTLELAIRHCPDADEAIIGTMSQRRKNTRSTKIKRIEKKILP